MNPMSNESFEELSELLRRDWDKYKWYIGGVLVFTKFIWPLFSLAGTRKRKQSTMYYYNLNK